MAYSKYAVESISDDPAAQVLFAVTSNALILPPHPRALIFRCLLLVSQSTHVGACNFLASRMPAGLVTPASGHDLRKLSALFDYIRVEIAIVIPALVVLELRVHGVNLIADKEVSKAYRESLDTLNRPCGRSDADSGADDGASRGPSTERPGSQRQAGGSKYSV